MRLFAVCSQALRSGRIVFPGRQGGIVDSRDFTTYTLSFSRGGFQTLLGTGGLEYVSGRRCKPGNSKCKCHSVFNIPKI